MSPALISYGALFVAIVLEVAGTTLLSRTEEFTRLVPTVLMGFCYLGAFYFLSVSLRILPVGIAYALWSAVGIVIVSIVAFVLFGQKLDLPAVIGMGLIISGVVVINVFSNSIGH